MVKALLEGRKQQTRRILKDQPGDLDKPFMMDDGSWHVTDSRGGHMSPLAVRFAKGDRLWVRESAWYDPQVCHGLTGLRCFFEGTDVRHQFSGPTMTAPFSSTDELFKVSKMQVRRPGIHMPRWASRLTLTVTDVRVQRLTDCTEEDALAEGVVKARDGYFIVPGVDHHNKHFGELSRVTAREMYAALWDVINGSGSWLASPWVVALTFTVERQNIDAARTA